MTQGNSDTAPLLSGAPSGGGSRGRVIGGVCLGLAVLVGAIGGFVYYTANQGGHAGQDEGICQLETGGECKTGHCYDWREAKCSWGKCVCEQGQCAREGACVTPMAPPEKAPESVAVVGCGIAGALTALELAHQGIKVTVFDREADCGVGTSGRIAAEMMFYSYHKAFFHGGWSKAEQALIAAANLQAGGSSKGAFNAAQYALKAKKISGNTESLEDVTYEKDALTFERGDGSPRVSAVGATDGALADVEVGWHLEDVQREVKQLTPYDLHHANEAEDVDKAMQDMLTRAKHPLKLKFLKVGEPRTNQAYQAGFFEAAGQRLQDFYLVEYPELCEAVVSPFCCVKGTAARAWVEANPDKAKYTCPADPFAPTTGNTSGMGVVHTFTTDTMVNNMVADGDEKAAWNFQVWNESVTAGKLKNWFAGQKMYGGAVNRQESGFVRTELIFEVIKNILEKKGGTFRFKRELAGIKMGANATTLETKPAGGSWKDSKEDNVRTFHPSEGEGDKETHKFDRVVISTGAAIGPGLDDLDPTLRGDHQLLPLKGYIILSSPDQLPHGDRDIGVVFELEHMYLRATREGAFAIGGGMYFGDGTDEDVRALVWHDGLTEHGGYFDAKNYMEQADIGKKLMKENTTLKLGGCRPMSIFGNFPLLKSYGSGRVVLNTGGGANGFVTSWKSAQLAAEIVAHGQVTESTWDHSYTKL